MSAPNQPVIFLDLDGVLADFDRHARAEGKIKPNGKVNYDALDYKWWTTMPPCDGARDFYDAACKEAPTRFLTGPVLSEECYAGKAHWVQDFVPERGKFILEDLIICDSENKFLIAAPGRILVDDRIANIEAWEAAGGIGIHHTGDFKETLKKVQAAVEHVKSPEKKRHFRFHFPKLRHG